MNLETIFNLATIYVGFIIFFQFVVLCLAVSFFVFFVREWRKMG